MKKIIPLWFADVIKTEEKLSAFSEKGLHLTDFSPVTGVASLEEGEQKKYIYRICLQKNCGGIAPKGVTANGWETVCGGKGYYIVRHSDAKAKVPDYGKWKTINRVTLVVMFMIMCYFVGIILGMSIASIDYNDPETIVEIPLFGRSMVMIVIVAVLTAVIFKANRRLAKTDTDLDLDGTVLKTVPKESMIFSKEEEKQLIKEGKIKKKAPIGWFYSPDKAEEMVEQMAAEGWKFYRFNKLGTVFYFIKSEPCRMKFVVDYQNEATDEYFLAAKDDGWKLHFTSMSRMQSFAVWAKEYDGEDEPEFYSDHESNLKRARRMALTFGIPFVFIMAFSIFVVISTLRHLSEGDVVSSVIMIAIYLTLTVEYGVFAFRTIGYYLRIRKNK